MKKKKSVDQKKYYDNYILTEEQEVEMIKRKNDFLAGRISSRPWKEIRIKYQSS